MAIQLHQTIIRFPEIRLATREADKLRGYFGNLFKEQSPLLHNHLESGETLYRYPMVQYKVLQGVPVLMGINEGADLLTQLFIKIRNIDIDGRNYPVLEKNIESKQVTTGLSDDLHAYRFETAWMALNQKNYADYLKEDEQQQARHLKAILIGNMLSFCKAIDYQVAGNILANLKITGTKETQFKQNAMLLFEASFVTNMLLPDNIGLGKQTARGFGSVLSA
ncbi:CRISPR-associated endonuclease Cas6 [Chitinophaga defluvii]|uniref:CRISPR-associated endonuclease Cas6 n=1 Tax=Chitinophaga defluvii TaxID=3163343 RepID=A0ABV2T2V0_9BACT